MSKFQCRDDDFVRSYGLEPLSDEDLQREYGINLDPMANDGEFVIVDIDGQTSRKSNNPEDE